MACCYATADTKPIEKKIHDQSEIALSLRSARAARDRIVNLLREYIIIIFIIISSSNSSNSSSSSSSSIVIVFIIIIMWKKTKNRPKQK